MKMGNWSTTLSQNAFGYTICLYYKGVFQGTFGDCFKKKDAMNKAMEVLTEAYKRGEK